MALSLHDCTFLGPALPEPFVKFQLEKLLLKRRLLPADKGDEGRAWSERWDVLRRKLRDLGDQGGDRRVASHVLEPLVGPLGYASMTHQESVHTREGDEDGGWWLAAPDGTRGLRAWSFDLGTDLDAPNRRGRAYRYSPSRVAVRVLAEKGERVALLTDGVELRLLIADASRQESAIAVRLDRSGGWRAARDVPDSFRLLVALASPAGLAALPDLIEDARLTQTAVTRKLRWQARKAVEEFVQEVLDHPANQPALSALTDDQSTARELWREGLVLIYRLLFVFKLESSPDPARAFSFASTSLWRNTYSPNIALAPLVRLALDKGADTGAFLETGLRGLFRLFVQGLQSSELRVSPLGGMLFGADTTPLLDRLAWGEQAVARLLDRLLWTGGDGKEAQERVHYGSLDVEDLGRVYESLLELEPGIATQAMCRLRRSKLEVVVPLAQGEAYRQEAPVHVEAPETEDAAEEPEEDEDNAPKKGAKTRVEWIEEIPPRRFYLRVGLGRKASGSYYTPQAFVRFLVRETLGPLVAECSPMDDPRPAAILSLKVVDPAMGSGHFLVEACRFLGDALYEACRLCDDLAVHAEDEAGRATSPQDRERLTARAAELRQRVQDLPDPDDALLAYLPSRVPEGEESGLSQKKAEALCRRLVAVHCLYGVDKNPLAVELAKLSLWLESYAEGLPLTFLDHRLREGDSLTGPFAEHLFTLPGTGEALGGLFAQNLSERLSGALQAALSHVADLEKGVGKDVPEVELKRAAKARLDAALAPLDTLAAAWSGGVMLGGEGDDSAYEALARAVADSSGEEDVLAAYPRLQAMIEAGKGGVSWDLVFPEVFHPGGDARRTGGFDVVLGNPPWEAIRRSDDQFFGGYDFRALAGATKKEKKQIHDSLLALADVADAYLLYVDSFQAFDRAADRLFEVHKARVAEQLAGRGSYDLFMLFAERAAALLSAGATVGWVMPSAFHSNEGGTGVRRLYLEQMGLRCCFSFENKRKLFEIDSRFKFALVVASKQGPTKRFQAAFYLHDVDWLFSDRKDRPALSYSLEFVRRTGGEYLSLLELRTARDLDLAEVCFTNGEPFGQVCDRLGIRLGQEVNMTYDSDRFTATVDVLPGGEDPRAPEVAKALREMGYLVLHEGKTFHQFEDRWEARPKYVVSLQKVVDKKEWLKSAVYYRLALRSIARSNDVRTSILSFVSPGSLFGNSSPCDRKPESRSNASALFVEASANAFSFDWVLRQKSSANVNLFILNSCPLPLVSLCTCVYFAHAALRLTCNHAGYEPLWREQLGAAWREPTPPFTWPVLDGADARWAVRAAIDAVVADAYGLTRDQYAHVLSTFSHRSYPNAPVLCLAAFDELQALGLEAFTKKHDPYWDIPLNENLPQPVITLPGVDETLDATSTSAGPSEFALIAPRELPKRRIVPPAPARPAPPASGDLFAGGPLDLRPGVDPYPTIRRLLDQRGVITSLETQAATGLDTAAVRPLLKRLVEEGLARVEGVTKGTRYVKRS